MVGVALGHLAKAKRATMEHNEKYHNLKGPMNHSPPPTVPRVKEAQLGKSEMEEASRPKAQGKGEQGSRLTNPKELQVLLSIRGGLS